MSKKSQSKVPESEKSAQRWRQDGKSARERLGYAPDAGDGIDCSGDEILTEQHHADELDINNIIDRYSPEVILASAEGIQASYGVATSDDLHSMMNRITSAQEGFMSLPAQLRSEFNNDPVELLRSIEASAKDDGMKKKLQDLGILKVPVVEAPVVPVKPAPGAGSTSTT